VQIAKHVGNVVHIYPSNLEMLGSARMTWFVDAAAI